MSFILKNRNIKLLKHTVFSGFVLLILLGPSTVSGLLLDEDSSYYLLEDNESTEESSDIEDLKVDEVKKIVNILYEYSLVNFDLTRKEICFFQIASQVIYLESISRPPQC